MRRGTQQPDLTYIYKAVGRDEPRMRRIHLGEAPTSLANTFYSVNDSEKKRVEMSGIRGNGY